MFLLCLLLAWAYHIFLEWRYAKGSGWLLLVRLCRITSHMPSNHRHGFPSYSKRNANSYAITKEDRKKVTNEKIVLESSTRVVSCPPLPTSTLTRKSKATCPWLHVTHNVNLFWRCTQIFDKLRKSGEMPTQGTANRLVLELLLEMSLHDQACQRSSNPISAKPVLSCFPMLAPQLNHWYASGSERRDCIV